MDYSFEHGIDHAGRLGIAPILVIGGPIQERDFTERNLESVAGVVIVEKGIPNRPNWKELNLKLLFSKIKALRYLSIEFEKKCDLNDVGLHWDLEFFSLNAPNATWTEAGLLKACRVLQAQAPLDVIEKLMGVGVNQMELIRPSFFDLEMVSRCVNMESLDIWRAKGLTSIRGIEGLRSLQWLGVHDCPSLETIDLPKIGPKEIVIGGCKKLKSIVADAEVGRLEKIAVLGSGTLVELSRSIEKSKIRVEFSGRDFRYVD